MQDWGVSFQSPEIDTGRLVQWWKNDVVKRLTDGLAGLAKRRKVQVIQGVGRFTDPHALHVDTTNGPQSVRYDHAIIAAGSRPIMLPGFPVDDPRLLDSTSALDLPAVGSELLVVGGGIIGLEMATFYHALGTKVTVVELSDKLLPEADPDLVRPLQRRLQKQYEGILLNTRVNQLEARDEGLMARFEGEKAPPATRFDHVLLAVGRRPNGDRIDAEKAGVRVDDRGFINVDRQQRTNVSHIFAIGDIVGQPMLAHKASHQGRVAAEVIAGQKSYFDARTVPSVAYTDPEIAWAGIAETDAKEQGLEYGKGSFPWAASGRSLALGRDEGLTKLLFEKNTGRLIGAGIVGSNAGELIAEAVLAIEMGADAQDSALSIHPHPTLSETLAFSAEAFEGTITDLYIPKRE